MCSGEESGCGSCDSTVLTDYSTNTCPQIECIDNPRIHRSGLVSGGCAGKSIYRWKYDRLLKMFSKPTFQEEEAYIELLEELWDVYQIVENRVCPKCSTK